MGNSGTTKSRTQERWQSEGDELSTHVQASFAKQSRQVELQLRREVMGGSGTCSEAMSSAWARERSCFGCEMRGNFTASCAMLQEWGGVVQLYCYGGWGQ